MAFSYTCDDCQFNVCVSCATQKRLLGHQGHEEHTLTLMQRRALFRCDACGEEFKESFYICTTCDFWIHKSCAISPLVIPPSIHHHHPLNLVYSIPDMHRYFDRECNICHRDVFINYWVYYCHKCTYFAHIICATSSTESVVNEIDEIEAENETDLVQLPLESEKSLFDLIINKCFKLQTDIQGDNANSVIISTIRDDPHIIEEHWSHKIHPLKHLMFTLSENDCDDNDGDRQVLKCNGCILPKSISHPSYYACLQCSFFLHSFCATKLPQELPAGACPIHPQHQLFLGKRDLFYDIVECGACTCYTNGFYYHCKTCEVKIDMRCAFLPTRIKHKSHEHHSLVQSPASESVCSVSKFKITRGIVYACKTCSSFQIDIVCAFYPSRMNHKYDLHSITLRNPPFFYEGVFYCEICEEQVNNQRWLYHCDECDQSFHNECVRSHYASVNSVGTVELSIRNQPHTLSLVCKRRLRSNSPKYFCVLCGVGYDNNFLLECSGCGILVCFVCLQNLGLINKPVYF